MPRRYAERMGRRYEADDFSAIEDGRNIGVYILTKGNNIVYYVGRSGADLKREIKQSIRKLRGIKYYWFSYKTSKREAYLAECRLYHKYDTHRNQIHPAVPAGTYWRCPNRNCDWGA